MYINFYINNLTETISDVVADNLRSDYMESRYNFDQDEWPPNQPKTVVNVALMHYKDSRTEQELIEISKRYKEGTHAIDELAHHSRVTKDISKIFATDSKKAATNDKPLKFILIEGAPGIGKTVLAKKIAYLWAKRKLLTDVNILFLLFLRDPPLQDIATPEQLVQYLSNKYLDEEQLKNCVDQIKELKVGIVMDGFDEYPTKLHKKSFIADLIKGKVFYNFIIVLTSRPTATISLHNKVDRRVEILGFSQEERDKYISDSLDLPEQRKQLQDYLKCQPIINGLVYVPLHLAILLYLFKIQSKLPETLTEMNESFILHTIYRSLTKDELTSTGLVTVVVSMKDLPENVTMIIKALSKLAFKGLQNDKLVFSYDEIKENCSEIENEIPGAFNGFGLLQVVQHFPKIGAGVTISFNFLHFTMQEYLASLYVSTTIPYKQQLSLMEDTFWNSRYNFMWMMYVGINGTNSQIFMQFLYKAQPGEDIINLSLSSSIQSDRLKCLHLFQCFMEAKSKTVPKEISSIFHNNEINFHGLRLLPYHISSLILYISEYSIQLKSLNLRDCHIGDIGMSMLERYFSVNPDKASHIKHIDLFGNNSILLWNVYCAIFGQQNLTKLNWSSLGSVNIEEVINVMENNTTVKSLDLSDNHFNDDDAKKIVHGFCKNNTLQELDLSQNRITANGAKSISKCIECNKILKEIDVSKNKISKCGLTEIAVALKRNKTLQSLNVSFNNISDDGAVAISECLKNNNTLQQLDMSHNKVYNKGIINIGEALQINTTLQILDISHNNFSGKGVLSFSECLREKNTLNQLKISWDDIDMNLELNVTSLDISCKYKKSFSNTGAILLSKLFNYNTIILILDISYSGISNDGAIAISECLKNNNTLQQLSMSHNKISNDGAMAISKWLKNNNTLQQLSMSHNKISNNGAVAISECLKSNDTLQQLNMSHNEVSNDGAVAISECLKSNDALQQLNMSHNEVSNDGAVAISECLKINNTLQTLNMSYNNISDDGAVAISESLTINNTLHKLSLSWDSISTEGITKIAEAIAVNTGLHTLDLSSQRVKDPKDLKIIRNKLSKVNKGRRNKGIRELVLNIEHHGYMSRYAGVMVSFHYYTSDITTTRP